MKFFSTYRARPRDLKPRWLEVDAAGQILGRLAAQVSLILQGKHRPTYTPNLDTGDFVVVINAEKVAVTGRKAQQKKYYHYTGYMSGLKEVSFREMKERKPAEIIRLAVQRMLPKTTMGRKMFGKLKVYAGARHPHAAQRPEKISLAV